MRLIQEITDAEFDELVINSKFPVLLLCTSPECIICKTMAERLKELTRDFRAKVIFLSLNINKNQSWQKFNVKSIPTLLYFKNGILLGRQDAFPEKEEIINKLKSLMSKKNDFIGEIRKSIEAEYVISRFYKYIANETKNGKVRMVFSKFNKESEEHRRLLEGKFKYLTGQPHQLDLNKFESEDFRPQSFSLMGAIKTAIQTEQNAFKFYKLASKKISPGCSKECKQMFGKLVKQEIEHFKALKRELQFLKARENFASMGGIDYHKWMNQLWK